MRLDSYLAQYFPEQSRSLWQKYIAEGCVSVNQKVVKYKKYILDEDDEVTFVKPKKTKTTFSVPIVYEDENVVVYNKPIGMLTHAKGGIIEEQTIADVAKEKTTHAAGTNRPGIIHRLDRATSGVIVVARNPETAAFLQRQFTDRNVKKSYVAIISNHPEHDEATIDVPIERNPKLPSQFRAGVNGKEAVTWYKVLQPAKTCSLIQLKPSTGRTHQLRVHMSHIKAPIVGDTVYGGAKADRMFLHAQSIELTLPGGHRKTFSTIMPAEFHEYLAKDMAKNNASN